MRGKVDIEREPTINTKKKEMKTKNLIVEWIIRGKGKEGRGRRNEGVRGGKDKSSEYYACVFLFTLFC